MVWAGYVVQLTAMAKKIKTVLTDPMNKSEARVRIASRQRVMTAITNTAKLTATARIRTACLGMGVSSHPRIPKNESR